MQPLTLTKRHFWLALSAFFYALVAILAVISAIYLEHIVDAAVLQELAKLKRYAIYLLTLIPLALLFSYCSLAAKSHYGTQIVTSFKDRALQAFLNMPIVAFKQRQNSTYTNAILNDIPQIDEHFYSKIPDLVYELIVLLGSLLVLYIFSPQLMWLFLCSACLPLALPYLSTRKLQHLQATHSKHNEALVHLTQELISGQADIVKNLYTLPAEQEFHQLNYDQSHVHHQTHLWLHFTEQLAEHSSHFAEMLCLIFAAWLVSEQRLSLGELVAALQMMAYCFAPLRTLGKIIQEMRTVKSVRNKVEELCQPANNAVINATTLKDIPKAKQPIKAQQVTRLVSPTLLPTYAFGSSSSRIIKPAFDQPDLCLKSVSLSHGKQIILDNFNYTFKFNRAYLITGENGSGKSSLLKLLTASNLPKAGTITLAGHDLASLDSQALYSTIAEVNQQTHIFAKSIRENIIMGQAFIQSAFDAVINDCQLRELLAKHGENPLVSVAQTLSVSEQERLALARALYRKARILIFDEPFVNLSPAQTKRFYELIFRLHKVTLIVASNQCAPEFKARFQHELHLNGQGSLTLTDQLPF